MSTLPKDDPDLECSWALFMEFLLAQLMKQDEYERRRRAAKEKGKDIGPKMLRFTSGPDYGDGCYNIKGNVDLRGLADKIVKFIREFDRKKLEKA